jgi:acyl-[acyl-carrier-protein]-phospholipid O-acyltransferase/long-chain-fatty-acid--[acyl-carrier-protein] ligase
MNEGGRLMVKGPNVMLGYMLSDNPGVIQPPYDEKLGEGWYDTGDVVKIADEGYIIIQGRAKRFAKIAGEMVSLQAVENFVNEVSPEHDHATINIEKSQGRELIILFTTDENLDRKTLSKEIKSKGIAEIYLPQDIRHIKEIPKLSTGKADYKALYDELEDSKK